MVLKIKCRKKLWNHLQNKSQFSTLLLFLCIDFTNNTQYSTSSWFQLSWRAVTDQLCRMESCHEPIFCHHKLSIGLRSGLFSGHVIEMKGIFWKKAITLFALWQDTLASWKIYLSSLNLFPVNWMRKVSKISMYTCALTP